MEHDIRDEIFSGVNGKIVTASIIADDGGIIADTGAVKEKAVSLGLSVERVLTEGTRVKRGDEIARFSGNPKQLAMAEEVIIGIMSKPSGIATAARRFVKKAGGRPEIVCGAWKKMPLSQKESIRRAIAAGGARSRICREPFVYLDKNYIEMLGGIEEGLKKVTQLNGHVKVVQLKGRYGDIADEAINSVRYGAGIVFIDTGKRNDIRRVAGKLRASELRDMVRIAFGGDIRIKDMDELKGLDVDILAIGRQIVDAPLLDMRMEVIGNGT